MRLINLAPTGNRSQTNRPRTGFTLIELMVAMALSLFLMAILSEAFAVSMDMFRGMRAIGDMQESLRNGLRQMRDDLASAHFEGCRKMSDNGFWFEPRREGFFYMKGAAPISEQGDANGMASSRAAWPSASIASNHVMHFAVRKQGYRPPNFFTVGPFLNPPFPISTASPPTRYVAANNPPDTYYSALNPQVGGAYLRSQWAEVAYLIRPMSGNPTTPDGGIPLFNLYRAEVLLLPYRDVTPIQNLSNAITVSGQLGSTLLQRISFNSLTLANFYSPNDVAMSTTRGFNPNATTPNSSQVSLVCSNVISFQVRLLVQKRTIGTNPSDPNIFRDPIQPTNTVLADMASYVFATNPTDPAIDTSATTTPSWAVPVVAPAAQPPSTTVPDRIMGVQIRLRIYDPASGQARQNTIVQGL